jgi:hypothetical protein
MKEDVLEQLVEDWFVSRPGWFVKHNIRYRPNATHPDYVSKRDSVHSDIDLLAISGSEKNNSIDRVAVITCKSWQGGFNAKHWKNELEKEAAYNRPAASFKPRESWKYFRELVSDKWMDAFLEKVESETGQSNITYFIAVTKVVGDQSYRQKIEESTVIRDRFKEKNSVVKIRVLTLDDLIADYQKRIVDKSTPALEATIMGRFLQLIHASGAEYHNSAH